MSTIELKYKAFELLMNTNDDSVLKEVMNLLIKDSTTEISDELKETLNTRRDNYLNGKSKPQSWEEVKSEAREAV